MMHVFVPKRKSPLHHRGYGSRRRLQSQSTLSLSPVNMVRPQHQTFRRRPNAIPPHVLRQLERVDEEEEPQVIGEGRYEIVPLYTYRHLQLFTAPDGMRYFEWVQVWNSEINPAIEGHDYCPASLKVDEVRRFVINLDP